MPRRWVEEALSTTNLTQQTKCRHPNIMYLYNQQLFQQSRLGASQRRGGAHHLNLLANSTPMM